MAAISIGDALGEGFNLIRKRPLTVLVWGAVRTAFSAGVIALMAPFYALMFGRIISQAKTGVAPPPPDIASLMQMQGVSWLLTLGGAFFGVVIYCAVFRAVLRPEDRRFAYLRVGLAELFLFVLFIGFYIAFFIGLLVTIIPVALLAGIAIAAHAPAVAVIVGVASGIAVAVLIIWVAFRFVLVGPMTVQDGKFHLFDAWRLSRGHAGALFLLALCLFVILLLIELVIGAIAIAFGIGILGQAAGGLQNLQAFFSQPPAALIASLAPALIIGVLFSIPVSGALVAIMAAPWARAYRDLAPPDVAATFA